MSSSVNRETHSDCSSLTARGGEWHATTTSQHITNLHFLKISLRCRFTQITKLIFQLIDSALFASQSKKFAYFMKREAKCCCKKTVIQVKGEPIMHGFCTPGMIMAAVDLIKRKPVLNEKIVREELEAHLEYQRILRTTK